MAPTPAPVSHTNHILTGVVRHPSRFVRADAVGLPLIQTESKKAPHLIGKRRDLPLHFRLPHVNYRARFGRGFFSLTEANHVMMPATSIRWCVLDTLLDPDGSSQMLARYARFMPTLVTCREAVDRRRTSYLGPMRAATFKGRTATAAAGACMDASLPSRLCH